MGSMLATPSAPAVDPELKKQREAEKERLKKEQEDSEARRMERERKQRANLLGARSLQSEDIQGFGGFRSMGSTKTKALKVD